MPTNAHYWVKWNTLGDSGFALETASRLNGPWYLPEYCAKDKKTADRDKKLQMSRHAYRLYE